MESQIEIETQSGFVKSQEELLELLSSRGRVSVHDISSRMDEAISLIELGLIRLEVSVYPWGVEFSFVAGKNGRVRESGVQS